MQQAGTIKGINSESNDMLGFLNAEQYEAVVTLDKALLVLSGAGTGKTKVLTTKIAYIIENGYAFPSQILAVTFSNRAAREMRERLFNLTNNVDGIWLGTFHAVCARILKYHADLVGISREFTIIDADDQLKIIKQILKEVNIDKKNASSIASKISRWKDKGITAKDSRLDATSREGKIYKIYQERIASYDSVDFGDLLLYVIEIFQKHPDVLQKYRGKFRYILVDEYQDTNMSQYMWLRMLSPLGQGICCVGDDDQAIYSWRGAEVGNILRFEKDFPDAKIVRLERNYRSKGHILGAASFLISHNENRLGKVIWTETDQGEKVMVQRTYNGFEEARFVAETIRALHQKDIKYGEIAILMRAGFQSREFEERFMAYGLPYRVVGGLKFYERQEIKDIVAYLRLIYQTNDSLAFERVVNVPKRGIGASAMAKFYALSREKNISLYCAAQEILKTGALRPSVKIALQEFLELIESLRLRKDLRLTEIAETVLNRTGYFSALNQEQTLESQGKIENLKELLIALENFEDLATFIEHISLVVDSPKNSLDEVINIITLHSAKGLEFEAIFLVGWEEGVFPHNLSLKEENVEEERRLAYVGITRAKKYAFISYALNRKIFNQWLSNSPSRFLSELPNDHICHIKHFPRPGG
ncbi:MAG: UvrD-helicase domain-containing protein [Holosporaceae bacterium]|jgi:DNA helicase-2/ATP-dependent DNA helicase PcrA|nr:UvrD-helicase domain-containing protein [Holosporaceae bacterium]